MKKNRASIVLVVSGLILTVAQSCIAVASGYLADVSEDGLANWVEQNGYLLTIADELFMFGTILLVASALYLFHTFSKRHMLSVAIGLAAWSTAAIGFVATILFVGRLIYPVNGFPIIAPDSMAGAVAISFASLHLASIALGIGTIAFGTIARQTWLKIISVIVGVLLCVGTYFAGHASTLVLILSANIWFCWMIIMSIKLKKRSLDEQ